MDMNLSQFHPSLKEATSLKSILILSSHVVDIPSFRFITFLLTKILCVFVSSAQLMVTSLVYQQPWLSYVLCNKTLHVQLS